METRTPSCLQGGHWKSGNLIVTPIECATGNEIVDFHSHKAGHNMFVLKGKFLVKTKDPTCGCTREVEFGAFSHAWIPAGVEHAAYPLEEGSKAMCVFQAGEFDEDVRVTELNGWPENNPFNIELPEEERFKPNPVIYI